MMAATRALGGRPLVVALPTPRRPPATVLVVRPRNVRPSVPLLARPPGRAGTLTPAEEMDGENDDDDEDSSGSDDGWFALDGAAEEDSDEDEDEDSDEEEEEEEEEEDTTSPSTFDPFEDANVEDEADDDWPPRALDGVGGGPPTLPPAAGGDVAAYVDAVLAGADGSPPLSTITGMFPWRLDPFQRRAIRSSLAGRNVLVCAPTGAGKTAIAAAAALGVLAAGKRVIYTTPLKALSNQKLGEFRAVFGSDRVGLQTGDATLNAEGGVVVMTTEVLRNILFRVDAAEVPDDGEEGGGDKAQDQPSLPIPIPARVADVGLIVLDEVHYLGDESRGTVWEETIIGAPPGASILAMSATVRNPNDLGDWITAVHGPCQTLRTADRPVPLNWLYAWGEPRGGGGGGRGWATVQCPRGRRRSLLSAGRAPLPASAPRSRSSSPPPTPPSPTARDAFRHPCARRAAATPPSGPSPRPTRSPWRASSTPGTCSPPSGSSSRGRGATRRPAHWRPARR